MKEFEVPKSVSIFCKNKVEAITYPWGKFKIGIDHKNSLLINIAHKNDENYPKAYYTNSQLSTTLFDRDIKNNIINIARKFKIKSIVEIGCGQGNLVQFLNKQNLKTIGYDPTILKESKFLKSGYYPSTKNKTSADLYILNCVLPHIVEPDAFLRSLFRINRKALVYIEFPNLKFILKNDLFFQFSYEHVNYFNFNYFKKHFDLIDKGSYRGGEWDYVLIKYKESNMSKNISIYFHFIWIQIVLRKRKRLLSKLSKMTN